MGETIPEFIQELSIAHTIGNACGHGMVQAWQKFTDENFGDKRPAHSAGVRGSPMEEEKTSDSWNVSGSQPITICTTGKTMYN